MNADREEAWRKELENAELKLSVEYWKRKAENKSHDGEKLVEKPLQDVRLGSAM